MEVAIEIEQRSPIQLQICWYTVSCKVRLYVAEEMSSAPRLLLVQPCITVQQQLVAFDCWSNLIDQHHPRKESHDCAPPTVCVMEHVVPNACMCCSKYAVISLNIRTQPRIFHFLQQVARILLPFIERVSRVKGSWKCFKNNIERGNIRTGAVLFGIHLVPQIVEFVKFILFLKYFKHCIVSINVGHNIAAPFHLAPKRFCRRLFWPVGLSSKVCLQSD
mmetsp:Transcript_40458/g.88789  ORF Transcript_40458/g.88789 Transcript_40458/m.88789 type:complete len:219 (+) Transcript_40458:658-1314(+)